MTFACSQLDAQEAEGAARKIEVAVKAIRFTEIDLKDASISEALGVLSEKMRALPPGSQVNLIIKMTPEELAIAPKITLKTQDSSLEETLKRLCESCQLEFNCGAEGVSIGKDLEENPMVLFPIRPEAAIFMWSESKHGKANCACEEYPVECFHGGPIEAYLESKGVHFKERETVILALAKGKLVVKASKERLDKVKAKLDEADAKAPKLPIDSSAAVKWVEGLPESIGHDEMLGAFALSWARSDLKAAIQVLDKTSPKVRDKLIDSIIVEGATNNRGLAMSLARTISLDRNRTMTAVARDGAENDYPAAMNLILSLPQGGSRRKALSGTLEAWAEKDAKAAQSFARSLPEGMDRQIALGAFSPINKKMKEIRIDHMEFEDAALPRIFAYLEKRSAELDPERKGVKIKLDPDSFKNGVTIFVDEIPLGEAIRCLCRAGGLDYEILETEIAVFKDEGESWR